MTEAPERMLDVLGAAGPHADHSRQLMLYGQSVGAWEGTVVVHRRDGTRHEESCEVHFGWVLEGRAVQDVWIAPVRKDRGEPGRPTDKDIYGTRSASTTPSGTRGRSSGSSRTRSRTAA